MAAKTKTYVWKDPSRLAGVVVVVLAIQIVLSTLSLVIGLLLGQASMYAADPTVLTPAQTPRLIIDLLGLLLLLVAIATPLWILRVSSNAHSVRPNMEHSVVGSIGWYLVPLVWFVKPFMAMSEIWEVSASGGGEVRKGKRRDVILNWWWGIFVAGLFVAYAAGSLANQPFGIWVRMFSDLFTIATCLVFMTVVRRISRMQVAQRHASVFSDTAAEGPLNMAAVG
jgi:hypothetical protein